MKQALKVASKCVSKMNVTLLPICVFLLCICLTGDDTALVCATIPVVFECNSAKYINDHNECDVCPIGYTCDGMEAVLCAASDSTPTYVQDNECKRCPSGYTCDGATAKICPQEKHIERNECKTCPSGSTCNGTAATPCLAPSYVKGNSCTSCPDR